MIDENVNSKRIEGQKWLDGITRDMIQSSSLVLIGSNVLIDMTKIAAITLEGKFSNDYSEGAIDLKLQLNGGSVVEASGLSRSQIEDFKESWIRYYNESKNAQSKIFRR